MNMLMVNDGSSRSIVRDPLLVRNLSMDAEYPVIELIGGSITRAGKRVTNKHKVILLGHSVHGFCPYGNRYLDCEVLRVSQLDDICDIFEDSKECRLTQIDSFICELMKLRFMLENIFVHGGKHVLVPTSTSIEVYLTLASGKAITKYIKRFKDNNMWSMGKVAPYNKEIKVVLSRLLVYTKKGYKVPRKWDSLYQYLEGMQTANIPNTKLGGRIIRQRELTKDYLSDYESSDSDDEFLESKMFKDFAVRQGMMKKEHSAGYYYGESSSSDDELYVQPEIFMSKAAREEKEKERKVVRTSSGFRLNHELAPTPTKLQLNDIVEEKIEIIEQIPQEWKRKRYDHTRRKAIAQVVDDETDKQGKSNTDLPISNSNNREIGQEVLHQIRRHTRFKKKKF